MKIIHSKTIFIQVKNGLSPRAKWGCLWHSSIPWNGETGCIDNVIAQGLYISCSCAFEHPLQTGSQCTEKMQICSRTQSGHDTFQLLHLCPNCTEAELHWSCSCTPIICPIIWKAILCHSWSPGLILYVWARLNVQFWNREFHFWKFPKKSPKSIADQARFQGATVQPGAGVALVQFLPAQRPRQFPAKPPTTGQGNPLHPAAAAANLMTTQQFGKTLNFGPSGINSHGSK